MYVHLLYVHVYVEKYHSLAKKNYLIFLLFVCIFNKEYFHDNNLKIYLLQIVESSLLCTQDKHLFLFEEYYI